MFKEKVGSRYSYARHLGELEMPVALAEFRIFLNFISFV